MNPLGFAVEVIFVSASGVLSPGPLFFTNIIYGSKQGVSAGVKTAFGHTIVELVIVLALGLFTFSQGFVNNENLKIISIIGGIAIIIFAFNQIIGITQGKVNKQNAYLGISTKKGPILLGLIFSAYPFFLIWWFTVGLKLISDSIHFFGLVTGTLFVLLSYLDGLCLVSYNILSNVQGRLDTKNQILFCITHFNKYHSCLLWSLYYSKYILMTTQKMRRFSSINKVFTSYLLKLNAYI